MRACRAIGVLLVCCRPAGLALAGKTDNTVRFKYPPTLDRADVYYSNGRLAVMTPYVDGMPRFYEMYYR